MRLAGSGSPGTEPTTGSRADRSPAPEDAPGREPTTDDVGWRRIIRNFTASWFSVNMGTGIVSILLYNLPYNASWIRYISYGFFLLNLALFSIFLAITLLRYILYPEIWTVVIRHPTMSHFLGCIPMALATLINMIVFVCAPWGNWVVYLAWALWWVDVAMSLGCCLTVPFIGFRYHNTSLENITATLLLPVVPVVVASASGGVVAEVLPNQGHAAMTVSASYILWGLGQTFSFFALATYFLRLQVHDLPPREAIVSVFLPIGPFGQGGFAILQLGRVALGVFSDRPTDGTMVGTVFYAIGLLTALLMSGAALGWLSFALISILTAKGFPFNMGWWGFTFPLGVCATCTGLLAKELSSPFFKAVTMVLSISVLLLWVVVAAKTVQLVVTGDLFLAPCQRELKAKEKQAGTDRTA